VGGSKPETIMKSFAFLLAIGIGTALVASPLATSSGVQAAQTKVLKKKHKTEHLRRHLAPHRRSGSRNFTSTPAEEPNGAGISDFCAHTLEIYGRMGVGCGKYGHGFMMSD
jgi:hypothetical protein